MERTVVGNVRRRYLQDGSIRFAVIAMAATAASFVNGSFLMASDIRSDEEVMFFPTLGRLSEDGSEWVLPIHGWIFEPEEGDLLRGFTLDWAAEALELPAGSEDDAVFRERIRWFLVDNERGKEITIAIAGEEHTLPSSTADGHFAAELRIAAETVATHAVDGWLPFCAIVDEGGERAFAGRIHLLDGEGTIVISDIDDTIKVTEVTDHRRLLSRTFLEPFEAVPGMADVYQRWADQGAAIHLVSNGPWQLYPQLSELFEREGFPNASWSMRVFRLKDRTGVSFLLGGGTHKLDEIARCIERYPEWSFVLVGDMSERDPQIYGEIARLHPDRITHILLRNVTEETSDSPRLREALNNVPADRWRLFTDAAELADVSLAD